MKRCSFTITESYLLCGLAQDPPGEVSQVGCGLWAWGCKPRGLLRPPPGAGELCAVVVPKGLGLGFSGNWGLVSLNKILSISSSNVT